jgi:hypothetical protein
MLRNIKTHIQKMRLSTSLVLNGSDKLPQDIKVGGITDDVALRLIAFNDKSLLCFAREEDNFVLV